MKRFVGMLLAGVGGAAALWGGFHVLTGHSSVHLNVTNTISVPAMVGGLIGVMLFTLGLIWVRD